MSKVVPLFENGVPDKRRSQINAIRREYGLSLLQGATALNISASELERLEGDKSYAPNIEEFACKFENFIMTSGGTAGNNLLFRTYPMRVAREILNLSVSQIAKRYGYTAESWKKIEANARPIDLAKIKLIENDVRDQFSSVCEIAM
jgi:transcriptional regulator with XRE-family HTH domain